MTPFRPSVDYQPLAPLRLDGLPGGRISAIPSTRFLLRGCLAVAALALPALGTRIAAAPQRPPMPGATQIAAILDPSPMGMAAIRLR
ncbi:hypothetical protein [Methylobacterium sp. J-090]|uniref:hypothetical protein n=1 Tax=Methylobacterium sp. J-090 TaxID=2836666 RepID=UPI001FB8D7B0|nr:hypothetical protein [Methylobacterium sp. J-090]MCJ2080344.1 hypothetical protein [Methylobacterium sp. J-090]